MKVCWIYVSEIPTARLRALNVALAAATQWLFNLVIARAVPNMLVTMGRGGYGAFITFACFCGSMFVFVWFLVPETKVSDPVRAEVGGKVADNVTTGNGPREDGRLVRRHGACQAARRGDWLQ